MAPAFFVGRNRNSYFTPHCFNSRRSSVRFLKRQLDRADVEAFAAQAVPVDDAVKAALIEQVEVGEVVVHHAIGACVDRGARREQGVRLGRPAVIAQ